MRRNTPAAIDALLIAGYGLVLNLVDICLDRRIHVMGL
jgi:hypothetical protein